MEDDNLEERILYLLDLLTLSRLFSKRVSGSTDIDVSLSQLIRTTQETHLACGLLLGNELIPAYSSPSGTKSTDLIQMPSS